MFNELIIRIGTFFLVVGSGIFVLFIASDFAGKTNYDYLFWAVLSVTVGFMLRRRRPPPPPSERFSSVRRLRERGRSDKEK